MPGGVVGVAQPKNILARAGGKVYGFDGGKKRQNGGADRGVLGRSRGLGIIILQSRYAELIHYRICL